MKSTKINLQTNQKEYNKVSRKDMCLLAPTEQVANLVRVSPAPSGNAWRVSAASSGNMIVSASDVRADMLSRMHHITPSSVFLLAKERGFFGAWPALGSLQCRDILGVHGGPNAKAGHNSDNVIP